MLGLWGYSGAYIGDGEPLTVQGSGVATPSTLTDQWFNVGPAPSNNGQSPQALPTSGRVISVAADPTDPIEERVSAAQTRAQLLH